MNNIYSKINEFIKKRSIIILIIVVAFLGGVVGSYVFSPIFSRASVLNDIYNQLFGNTIGNTNQTQSVTPYQGVDPHEQAIISAVQKNSPSVVSITISKNVPIIEQCPYNPFSDLPQEFQQFFNFGGSQFTQPCQKGTQLQEVGGGSGFIVSSDGLIVTNKHVVSDTSAEYTVFTNDGKKYTAKVLARHPSLDLAVLKISASSLPTVVLGDSNGIQLGQTSISIGNALGEFRNTVSVGVISGLSRSVTASDQSGQTETIDNVIQTDAAINPGNSGGPLINLRGEVIGINVAMVSGAQNIGFSIPINAAKQAINSVISSGTIKAAYLGVRYVILNSDNAAQYKISQTSGALIKGDNKNMAVEQESPADKAGLKEGDVIIAIDGQTVSQDLTPAYIISQKNPGDTVAVKIIRNGKEMTVNVILGERK